MFALAKAAFRGARDAIDDLGITPDRLEREATARLTLSLGDLSLYSQPPPGQPFEVANPIATGTALRFAQVIAASPRGFWFRSLRINPAAVATPAGYGFTLVPPVVANGFGTTRSSPTGVDTSVVFTGGDSAAAFIASYVVPAATVITPEVWTWVAPGVFLVVSQQNAGGSVDLSIMIASPKVL